MYAHIGNEAGQTTLVENDSLKNRITFIEYFTMPKRTISVLQLLSLQTPVVSRPVKSHTQSLAAVCHNNVYIIVTKQHNINIM